MPPSDDFDLNDILGDPNGPAYQRVENRIGPPLAYVSEKVRNSLQSLHHQIQWIRSQVPEDLPAAPKPSGKSFPTKRDDLLTPARYAFHYGVVAFLALNNMLNLANDHGLFEHLLAMDDEAFELWLGQVEGEGSVTGDSLGLGEVED